MQPERVERDDEAIFAEALLALASPVRLSLLRQLRSPKTLSELRVVGGGGDGERDRTLARQTIRAHLEKLVQVGVVVAQPAERDYGETVEYVLNQQTLYALSEEFLSLAALRPEAVPVEVTLDRAPPPRAQPLRGACLVLVKGVEVGRTFPLDVPAGEARREWVVGRRRGLAVSMDFDPFVSSAHARILWEAGRFSIEDLEGSRNGTSVNFAPLAKGDRRALKTGDVVGVGRSLLMMRE